MSQEVDSNVQEVDENKVDYKKMYEEKQATIERLLSESKKYKTRYEKLEEMKSELESLKEEKVNRDGGLEEKVGFYKSRFDEALNENRTLKTDIVMSKLERSFRRIAPDCHNPEFVINNPANAETIKAAVDTDNLSIDTEVLKSLYQQDKDENPFLYGRNTPARMVGGGATSDTKMVDQEAKKISEMTPAEYKEHLLNKYKK